MCATFFGTGLGVVVVSRGRAHCGVRPQWQRRFSPSRSRSGPVRVFSGLRAIPYLSSLGKPPCFDSHSAHAHHGMRWPIAVLHSRVQWLLSCSCPFCVGFLPSLCFLVWLPQKCQKNKHASQWRVRRLKLIHGRSSCKLRYAVGAAPVCYGVPISASSDG